MSHGCIIFTVLSPLHASNVILAVRFRCQLAAADENLGKTKDTELNVRSRAMAKTTCAVIGCSNSTYRLLQWKRRYCKTHRSQKGVGRCVCPPPFVLYPFPTGKNGKARSIWIDNVNRVEPVNRVTKVTSGKVTITKTHRKGDKWEPTVYDRVCSEHFIDSKPTEEHPYPTIQMGHVLKERKRRKSPMKRVPLPKKQRIEIRTSTPNAKSKNCDVVAESQCDQSICNDSEPLANSMCDESHSGQNTCNESESLTNSLCDHSYSFVQNSCDECRTNKRVIHKLLQEIDQLKENLDQVKTKMAQKVNKMSQLENSFIMKSRIKEYNIVSICLRNDYNVKFYTGIPTLQLFDLLYKFIFEKVSKMSYWRGRKKLVEIPRRAFNKSPRKFGAPRKLSIKEELILVLMKLRLGLLNQELADRFNVSTSTVSSVFSTWIPVLAANLKFLIYWPDKISVRSNLPKVFEKLYPHIRVILDCSEFFIDVPRDLKLQAMVFSDYKHHTTLKTLIGITPRGCISFVSKCFGGRASDRRIVLKSNILDYVDPGDQWMADRGFLIRSELLERGGELIIPPGAKGHEQMIPSDVEKTKHVANLRIHVERAIQRMKCFRFLKNQIQILYLPLMDNILIIVAALCNLQPPLVK